MPYFLMLIFLQLLSALFFMRSAGNDKKHNRFLLLILYSSVLSIGSKLVYFFVVHEEPSALTISSTLAFVVGSHFFIREVLEQKSVKTSLVLLHLIPFFISVLAFSVEVFCGVFGFKIPLSVQVEGEQVAMYLRLYLLVFYFCWNLYYMYLYRVRLRSLNKKVDFYLILFFMTCQLYFLSLFMLSIFRPTFMATFIGYIGYLQAPMISVVITYYKIIVPFQRQQYKMQYLRQVSFVAVPQVAVKQKYAKNEVNSEQYSEQEAAILNYMEKQRPYLDAAFSFEQLADTLALSKHDVSYVLNQKLGVSFYQLINEKRINYFLEHLDKVIAKEQTILGLAYESGFNSKSTFNKYFKQTTSMAPSTYVKLFIEEGMKTV